MRRAWSACALALALAACTAPGRQGEAAPAAEAEAVPEAPTAAPAPAPAAEPAPTSQPASDGYAAVPTRVEDDGTEVYGGALDPAVEEVALSALLAEPARYGGRTVRTSGTVERVCKNQGCWMELSGDDPAQQIRAPMAGHAYAVPQKAVGRKATVQGTVKLRELTPEQKAHYEAEGARATDVHVSIDATAVAVR